MKLIVGMTVLLLTACTGSLQKDFDKATRIGEFALGDVSVTTVKLPSGSAQLIVAIPDYRCHPIADGPVSIVVRDEKRVLLSERIPLSQLTWSFGERSCDAYGYLKDRKSVRIDSSSKSITVRIDTTQLRVAPPRRASAWFVYGDRVPAGKGFGVLPDSE